MVEEMDQIAKLIRERFPLLERLLVQSVGGNALREQLPPFLGMLLAVMDAPAATPTCFVFPRRGEVGRLAVVLHALQQFVKEQLEVTHAYIDANFKDGDPVRVNPSNHVFRYRGFDLDSVDYIKLEALHETGGWRLVRAADIMGRLEKTNRTRPLGSLSSQIHSPPRAPIDNLLGTSSYGNQSLIKNAVVLLDSQSGLRGFAESAAFLLDGSIDQATDLNSLFSFGQLTQPGSAHLEWFQKWHDRNPTGEPLVAVTHSAELMANYCLAAPARSKLIAVNGLSRLRNLQAYDDISQTQKLVLFSDLDDEEMIQVLGQRGCRFWWLSASEMSVGVSTESNRSKGLIGEVIRWSRNHDQMVIEAEHCESPELECVWSHIEQLREPVNTNPDGPLTKLVSRGWRILNDACAVICPLDNEEYQRRCEHVAALRRELEANSVWLSPENIAELIAVANGLNAVFVQTASLGFNKGEALYRLLRETLNAGLSCALLARNEGQVESLSLWLQQHDLATRAKVYSPRTLPDKADVDCVICVSWLGSALMKQVAVGLVAPRFMVLAYPFEQRWLKQFERHLRHRPEVPSVTSLEKTALIVRDGETMVAWPEDRTAETPSAPAATTEADIGGFEHRLQSARKGVAATPTLASDTVSSRYVSFYGDSFVFLTETHKVPVATEIVSGRGRSKQNLPECVVGDIKQGDFIVFPKSGDRELIQDAADKLLGEEALELRELVHLWKDALWHSDITPEAFLQLAKELGRPRHILTIRNWFSKTYQIGPQTEEDLMLIQRVTGNTELENRAEEVWNAIGRVRGAHLSAGMRLRDVLLKRLPTVIGQIEENGTEVDLGELGSAWVVQVESMASDNEPRGRSEINRLLWENPNVDLLSFL